MLAGPHTPRELLGVAQNLKRDKTIRFGDNETERALPEMLGAMLDSIETDVLGDRPRRSRRPETTNNRHSYRHHRLASRRR